MLPQSFLKHLDTSPRINLAGDAYTVLATGKETSGAYAALHFAVPPGGGPPPHTHTKEDEMFFVLEGELTFYVKGQKHSAPQGTFVNAVRNVPHFFRNESSKIAKALVWVQPAGLEELFLAVGRPLKPEEQPQPPAPEEITKLIALAPQYGVILHLEKH